MDSDGQQARIEELEAELARQIACREDSDRKLMAADDALNRTAYELAEARKEAANLIRQTTPMPISLDPYERGKFDGRMYAVEQLEEEL